MGRQGVEAGGACVEDLVFHRTLYAKVGAPGGLEKGIFPEEPV